MSQYTLYQLYGETIYLPRHMHYYDCMFNIFQFLLLLYLLTHLNSSVHVNQL